MLKKLLCGAAVALVLSGCGSHYTQSLRSEEYKASGQTNLSSFVTVEEMYKKSHAVRADKNALKKINSAELQNAEEVRIKLTDNFGMVYTLCNSGQCRDFLPEKANETQSMYPISSNKEKETSGTTHLVAEVELSSGTQAKIGAPLPEGKKNIVILPPDVELSELGAGGGLTPNALWTAAATKYVSEISAQYFEKLGYGVSFVERGSLGVSAKSVDDLAKLNSQVGLSVMLFQQSQFFRLPTWEGKPLNWPLGKGTKELQEKYGANYGLFIYLRDSYASGSRVAASILSAMVFGVALPGGQQIGFASLVDLDTGKLVWFNSLSSGSADLRTFEAAVETTNALYTDMPL